MIKINGELFPAESLSLLSYLEENGYPLDRIAVERNGEIIPKARYAECVLQDGDVVEIVSLVGGG